MVTSICFYGATPTVVARRYIRKGKMMNSEIVSYEFGNLNVRVEMVDGEPWFVAKDVCSALGIEKHRDAVGRLDDDERGSVKVDTLGGNQNMTIINESGLYSLILRSNKPEAKVFKRWVTKEVLPSIRKTGGYRRVEVSREDKIEGMMNQIGAGFEAMSETVSLLAKRLVALESRQAQLPRQARALRQDELLGYEVIDRRIEPEENNRVRVSLFWSKEEDMRLWNLRSKGYPYRIIADSLDRSVQSVRGRFCRLKDCGTFGGI